MVSLYEHLRAVQGRGRIGHLPFAAAVSSSDAVKIIHQSLVWDTLPGIKGFPLGDLLIAFKHMESTDIRDKVYGLLGLVDDDELQSLGFFADYSKSGMELYASMLRSIQGYHHLQRKEFDKFASLLQHILRLSSSEKLVEIETQKIIHQSEACTSPTSQLNSSEDASDRRVVVSTGIGNGRLFPELSYLQSLSSDSDEMVQAIQKRGHQVGHTPSVIPNRD
jgi:hypothetical protein